MRKILRYIIAAAIIFLALMIISVVRNWSTVQSYFDSSIGYILSTILCIVLVVYGIKLMIKAVLP